ncbi:nodulation protein NfeD [Myxococcota bacterium]|nr:nodulation protein NfeD [Myxococcota bacterium]MBU1432137.1 nodulation protein NfeD [Myxococcota bacterium]MBU1898636.1 nodulation protein NfeD [Myxococcota bacterium]
MKTHRLLALAALIWPLLVSGAPAPTSLPSEEAKPAYTPFPLHPLPTLATDGGRSRRVLVIPIKETIDLGLAPFVTRMLEARAHDVSAVILDVDTFGGRVDAAVKIRDALLATRIPTIAFVNRRAISAGALISLAADHIVFTRGASMGAATPIEMSGGEAKAVGEKMVSYMRSEMASTAQAKGRDGRLAEAMVDADIALEGVTEKGKLLTVTTNDAARLGLADAQAETLNELLKALGLEYAEVKRANTNWAEQLARFLTNPVVSGLLMSLGMLGLLLELYTPGFGFAGALGLLCLVLFFGGHMVVDLAGWEEVTLFILGLIALAAEIFILPGFGVAGVLGIAMIAASLIMAMLSLPLGTAWDLGLVNDAMSTVMLSLVGTTLLAIAGMRFLPDSRLGRGLILQTTLGSRGGDVDKERASYAAPEGWSNYVGQRGVAKTDLRMSGKAKIGGELVDVVSQGEYIDAGTPIRVVDVEGVRVVVVADSEEPQA